MRLWLCARICISIQCLHTHSHTTRTWYCDEVLANRGAVDTSTTSPVGAAGQHMYTSPQQSHNAKQHKCTKRKRSISATISAIPETCSNARMALQQPLHRQRSTTPTKDLQIDTPAYSLTCHQQHAHPASGEQTRGNKPAGSCKADSGNHQCALYTPCLQGCCQHLLHMYCGRSALHAMRPIWHITGTKASSTPTPLTDKCLCDDLVNQSSRKRWCPQLPGWTGQRTGA